MSDARRKAEEALAKYDAVYTADYWSAGAPRCFPDHCTEALRALLAASPEPVTALPEAVREFIERVAAGPCWANRGGMTECAEAFLPRGERHPREFCLRCHAKHALAALGGAR